MRKRRVSSLESCVKMGETCELCERWGVRLSVGWSLPRQISKGSIHVSSVHFFLLISVTKYSHRFSFSFISSSFIEEHIILNHLYNKSVTNLAMVKILDSLFVEIIYNNFELLQRKEKKRKSRIIQ